MTMLDELAEGRFAYEFMSALRKYADRDSGFQYSVISSYMRYNSPSPDFRQLPHSVALAHAVMGIGLSSKPEEVGLRRPVLISGSSGLVSIILNGSVPLAYCDVKPDDDVKKSVRRQLTGYDLDGSVMAHVSLEDEGVYILGREGGEQNRSNLNLWTPSGKVVISKFVAGGYVPSALHAAIFSFDDGVAIADLGSLGGTSVMGMGYSDIFSVNLPGRRSSDKPVHSVETVAEPVPHASLSAYVHSIGGSSPESGGSSVSVNQ